MRTCLTLFFLLLFTQASVASCPTVDLSDLYCVEQSGEDTLSFIYEKLKVYQKNNKFWYLIKDENIESERSLPITNTASSGFESLHYCQNNKIISEQSYLNLKAKAITTFTDQSMTKTGEHIIQHYTCDSNDNCTTTPEVVSLKIECESI